MQRLLAQNSRRTVPRSIGSVTLKNWSTISYQYNKNIFSAINNSIKSTNYSNDFNNTSKKRYFSSQSIPLFEFNNLAELQLGACQTYPNNDVFGTRNGDKYEWMKYKEFGIEVEKFRKVLRYKGISANDKVAIISNNRVEWAVVMYASVSIGAQIVPMYEAQLPKDWEFIINDSDAKLLVVANDLIYNKVSQYVGTLGKLDSIVAFDRTVPDDTCYKHLMSRQSTTFEGESSALTNISKDQLAFIIYTSGTTGVPKGVELSHGNFVSNVKAARNRLGLAHLEQRRSLAFLPWAHVFGLTSELNSFFSNGSCMGIVPSREQILECLAIVKPEVILSVPILFNRVYDGAMGNINKETGIKRKLVDTAFSIARSRNAAIENGESVNPFIEVSFRLFDKLVFSKIRAKLGGNLKYMASGGAATSIQVLHFFEDIGIPITEGYGLTETSPIITVSGMELGKERLLGCVGYALEGVTLRIIDPETLKDRPAGQDGEIVCSGPNVMQGYRNNPKANDEVFFYDDKGNKFFRTGDLGRLVQGKFLKITGRIKEQFKLENGKYVVPAPVEDAICRSQFFNQAMLYGINKPCTIVLLVPNMIEVNSWLIANKEHLPPVLVPQDPKKDTTDEVTLAALSENKLFNALICAELETVGANIKSYERPQHWRLISEPFTQENQMLTPKMSLRRANILKKYQTLINDVYRKEEGYPSICE